jgi:hypothetical protein
MAWAWLVVLALAIGLPAALWLLSRKLKPSRDAFGGPVPKFDRVGRWLYDRHQLSDLDRWRVRQAVMKGRELQEPPLRQAAHNLAGALLSGQVGSFTRANQWIWLGVNLGLITTVAIVALVTRKYEMLGSLVFAVILLPLALRAFKRTRERVEHAYRLNA